jgi:pimeloyl-ACP methyl ester carboxylesterase
MSDLASIRPQIEAALKLLNVRLAAGDRAGALRGLNELTNRMIHTQRPDITAACYLLPGRSVSLSVCRIPAAPRPDWPIAVFVPGLGASLLLAAVHALALIEHFDIVVCSLPGHSGSDELPDVSLAGFSDECAALVATAMPRARNLFVIGQSLGGLIALQMAHRRPDQIRHVILLDPPFRLTRPRVARVLHQVWRFTGENPYQARICQEIMGFDAASGAVGPSRDYHDLVRGPFNCLLLQGGNPPGRMPSFVEDEDVVTLRAHNPSIMVGARLHEGGHALLADNPAGVVALLDQFLMPAESALPR